MKKDYKETSFRRNPSPFCLYTHLRGFCRTGLNASMVWGFSAGFVCQTANRNKLEFEGEVQVMGLNE